MSQACLACGGSGTQCRGFNECVQPKGFQRETSPAGSLRQHDNLDTLKSCGLHARGIDCRSPVGQSAIADCHCEIDKGRSECKADKQVDFHFHSPMPASRCGRRRAVLLYHSPRHQARRGERTLAAQRTEPIRRCAAVAFPTNSRWSYPIAGRIPCLGSGRLRARRAYRDLLECTLSWFHLYRRHCCVARVVSALLLP